MSLSNKAIEPSFYSRIVKWQLAISTGALATSIAGFLAIISTFNPGQVNDSGKPQLLTGSLMAAAGAFGLSIPLLSCAVLALFIEEQMERPADSRTGNLIGLLMGLGWLGTASAMGMVICAVSPAFAGLYAGLTIMCLIIFVVFVLKPARPGPGHHKYEYVVAGMSRERVVRLLGDPENTVNKVLPTLTEGNSKDIWKSTPKGPIAITVEYRMGFDKNSWLASSKDNKPPAQAAN